MALTADQTAAMKALYTCCNPNAMAGFPRPLSLGGGAETTNPNFLSSVTARAHVARPDLVALLNALADAWALSAADRQTFIQTVAYETKLPNLTSATAEATYNQ